MTPHLTASSARKVASDAILVVSQKCHACRMTEVASSRTPELNPLALEPGRAAGEELIMTVDGRPTATLRAISESPRWMSRQQFVETVLSRQADPSPADDLRNLAGKSTDDTPTT